VKRHRWLLDAGALVLILAVGAFLRFWRLSQVPPGLFHDEAFNGLDALRVLEGYRPIFFPANAGREPLFIYLQAAVAALGASPPVLRATSALVGLATLPAIYWLGRELFGSKVRRGRAVGLLAAAIMAVSYWHLSFSRLGLRGILLPFVSTLAFALLARGLRKGGKGSYVGAGLFLGLCAYSYLAARFLPLVLVALAVVWAASRAGLRDGINWQVPHRGWRRGLILFLGVSLIVFAPLGIHYITHPGDFGMRTGDIAMGWGNQGTSPWNVGSNALRVAGMFGWQGDTHRIFNLPGRPALDALSLAGFILGLGVAAWRWRRASYSLLLVWLVVMLLPSILSTEAPHTLRAIGALPPTCLLVALGLWAPVEFLPGKENGRWRQALPAVLASTVLLVSGTLTWRDYFGNWAGDADTYYAFQGDLWDLTQGVLRLHDEGNIVVPLELYDHPTVAFGLMTAFPGKMGIQDSEAGETAPVCMVISEESEVAPLVLLRSSGGKVQFLPPPGDDGRRMFDEGFDGIPSYSLRDAYGREMAEARCLADGNTAFELPAVEMIPLETTWQGGVGLSGYALVPGRVEPGEEVQVTLYWQATRQVDEDYRSFVHLVDVEGKTWVGADRTPVAEVYPTSAWTLEQTLPGTFHLTVPSLSPWGRYRFEVGLENPSVGGRVELAGGVEGAEENRVLLGALKVRTAENVSPADIEHPLEVRLGSCLDLLGYDISPASAVPGGELSLALYWKARCTMDMDYTVFVHLMDGAGQIVAQQDSQPRDGSYPTSIWDPGEVVPDEYAIIVPPDLPAGEYEAAVGMYYLPTEERLPATDPSGTEIGDRVVLGSIQVR
jgi:4-amino-4-deoxy-L-arabinose transferase-like glycosyltransferase